MPQSELVICENSKELAETAAERICHSAVASIASRGQFTLCLTGGKTPRGVYEVLSRQQGAAAVDWSKTFLFFGDERFVPPDDDRSNYKMARQSLFDNAPIAPDHVFPVPTQASSPQEAAQQYAHTLQTFFAGAAWPEFDLVLLGLGEDGHVASLFPGAATLRISDRWATWSPPGTLPPHVDRVTLTFPALNAAREVMFLISGEKKAPAFADVYQDRPPVEVRPAAGIQPANGPVVWIVDRAAAELLKFKAAL